MLSESTPELSCFPDSLVSGFEKSKISEALEFRGIHSNQRKYVRRTDGRKLTLNERNTDVGVESKSAGGRVRKATRTHGSVSQFASKKNQKRFNRDFHRQTVLHTDSLKNHAGNVFGEFMWRISSLRCPECRNGLE